MSDTRRTADCARAQLLGEQALDGRLDAEASTWLAAHRQVCPDCRAVAEALAGSGPLWRALEAEPEPVMDGALGIREQVIDHLAGRPVDALRLERRPRLALMLVGTALVAAFVLALGLRSDYAQLPWYQVLVPGLILVAGFYVGVAAFDRPRSGRRARLAELAVLVGTPAIFVAAASLVAPSEHGHAAASLLGPALGCCTVGLLFAAAVLVPAIVLARRGMAGPSQRGAVLLGVGAASLGVGTLHLRCGLAALDHVLLGHGLVLLLIPLAAVVLRRHRRLA